MIRTQPNRERVAEHFLASFGYDTYLPMLRVEVRSSRKSQWVDRPFLPMYLFLWDDGDVSLSRVKNAPGVSGFMRCGADAAWAAQWVIDGIRCREVAVVDLADRGKRVKRLELESPKPSLVMQEGDTVLVTGDASPFKGLRGLFQHRIDDERVAAFVRIMGRLTRVTMNMSDLSAA